MDMCRYVDGRVSVLNHIQRTDSAQGVDFSFVFLHAFLLFTDACDCVTYCLRDTDRSSDVWPP